MPLDPPDPADPVLREWAAARSVAVLTGAGVSAESGLATFRGPEGLWEGSDPMELATPEAFADDPVRVWRFYAWRRRQALRAEPNAAHRALARIVAGSDGGSLTTQNVDGLHERAGTADVLRLHGHLWTLRCVDCDRRRENTDPDTGADAPPRCSCGGRERPDVVWFGESLDGAVLAEAERRFASCDAALVVGTSGLVYPAAGLPAVAKRRGRPVLEVNVEPTALTSLADLFLAGPAGEIVPGLAARRE